jgi:hypothetical protein
MKVKKVLLVSFSEKKEYLNDICAICQENIIMRCGKCQNTSNTCNTIIGKCKHIFHNDCLKEWLQKNNKCPIDNKKFEYLSS